MKFRKGNKATLLLSSHSMDANNSSNATNDLGIDHGNGNGNGNNNGNEMSRDVYMLVRDSETRLRNEQSNSLARVENILIKIVNKIDDDEKKNEENFKNISNNIDTLRTNSLIARNVSFVLVAIALLSQPKLLELLPILSNVLKLGKQ